MALLAGVGLATSCGPGSRIGSDAPVEVDADPPDGIDWVLPDSDVPDEVPSCAGGLTLCGTQCVDLQTDPANCGSCGSACAEQRMCVTGACMCREGLTVCGSSCVNTSSDPLNCGGCGIVCEGGMVCSGSRCSLVCDEGLTNCGGACVDIMTDVGHCGGCTNACEEAEGSEARCSRGSCENVCLPDRWDLDGEPGCEYLCVWDSDTELCNGVDDDCNGSIDEGFDCVPGSTVPCTTACGTGGTGPCTDLCSPPPPASCVPPGETCNGADDNCDGEADDGFPCVRGAAVGCTTSCGTGGNGTCSDLCTLPAASECAPPAETCNGADDDCDGTCDDGFGCCLGVTGVSCVNGAGVGGFRDCAGGCVWSACCAAAESCGNGFDDDCDGTADDGCAVCGNCTRESPEQCDDCNVDETDACKSSCVHVWQNANQLYCNGTCTWAGGDSCDQADADIYCKLKMRNPLSTASSFSTTTALAEEGFSCPGYGRNIGTFPAYGVTRDVWYQTTSILANHGPGTVVYNITCTNP